MLADLRLKKFDVIILNRGMISMDAIADMKKLKQKVIPGLRLNERLKVDYVGKIDREQIFQPAHRVVLKNTEVSVQDFYFEGGKLLAVYNTYLEKLKRQHAIEQPEEYDHAQARYMDYYRIYQTSEMTNEKTVQIYFERDIVEKAYRELKTSINLNPARKYRLDCIRAHVKICYLA